MKVKVEIEKLSFIILCIMVGLIFEAIQETDAMIEASTSWKPKTESCGSLRGEDRRLVIQIPSRAECSFKDALSGSSQRSCSNPLR